MQLDGPETDFGEMYAQRLVLKQATGAMKIVGILLSARKQQAGATPICELGTALEAVPWPHAALKGRTERQYR